MINKAILVGNLGHNPQMRSTQDGKSVGNFSIATSEKWTDKDGNKQEKTEWHRIIVWDKLADNCGKYIEKGSRVFVEGKITTRKWQDKEGNDRWSTEIVARDVKFLSFKEREDQASPRTPSESDINDLQNDSFDPGAPEFSDDDVPF